MRSDNMDEDPLVDINRRLKRLESGNNLGYSAISEGSLRVASAEGLLVEGSERVTGILIVDGTLQVTGSETVSGTLVITGGQVVNGSITNNGTFTNTGPFNNSGTFSNSGPFDNTGKLTQNGDADLNGNTRMQGDTTITGTTSLQADLNISGGGKINAGSVVIDGTSGGRVAAPGSTLILVGSSGVSMTGNVEVHNNMLIEGALTVLGAKAFGIEHPGKPGVMLRHAATESPVSGLEYWGDAELDSDGHATVTLPDYFDALAKPDGRTVFITGRGHSPDWSDIDADHFTVTGSPGGRFSWLVKAERFGGDFDLEQPMPTTTEPQEA